MQAAGASPAGIPAEPHVSGASSWHRVREVIVTVAAIMGGLGVLIAGIAYAVQPVREDVRVLQETSADFRERLARLEEGQATLKEGQADLETRMVNLEAGQAGLETRMVKLEAGQARLEEGQAGLEARMMKLEEGQIRILALLERGGVPGTSR